MTNTTQRILSAVFVLLLIPAFASNTAAERDDATVSQRTSPGAPAAAEDRDTEGTSVSGGAPPSSPFTTFPLDLCRSDLWYVNPTAGPQVSWPALAERQAVASAESRRAALATWSTLPEAIDQEIATLQKGLREGHAAAAPVVRRVVVQLDDLLAAPAETSPLRSPARRAADAGFAESWHRLIDEDVEPAFRRYRDYLERRYLPAARRGAEVGIASLPNGSACYREMIRRWTSLDLPPEEIRRRGEAEIGRLTRELAALLGAGDEVPLEDLLDRLRNLEPGFHSREKLLAHLEDTVARALETLPRWFVEATAPPVVVQPMPSHLAATSPAAFYRPPATDGAPGVYLVNPARLLERPLLAEAITFHETLPGHHAQLTYPVEAGADVPGLNAGFLEGWAVYAERLAAEQDLYSSPHQRLGLVAKQLWAASRLVVEPGLHVDGWSREQAVTYLRRHTLLPAEEIEVEVDRYLALPGQSLAYTLGALFFEELRTEAEEALGPNFDLRRFHHVLLQRGTQPLPQVRRRVEQWIADLETPG